MAATTLLPIPQLNARRFGARCISVLTDDTLFDQTGVRIAFSGRDGGVSEGAFASLNLGMHVGDDAQVVGENRSLLLEALGGSDMPLVVPSQVHGDTVVTISDTSPLALSRAREVAAAGADALIVTEPQVAALLCFADCVPVIIVSPTGRFVVAHAGWRGVMNGVAAKAVRMLADIDAPDVGSDAAHTYNVYVGPHIHVECFETGEEVRTQFIERFGALVSPDDSQVDLLAALSCDLVEAGVLRERIVDAGVCTMCEPDRFFSYRASGGICGRHGAIALRKAE